MELTLTRREDGPNGEKLKYVFVANQAKRSWSVGVHPRNDVPLGFYWSSREGGSVVSNFHCRIEYDMDMHTWSLYDMGRNGTWVNGVQAKAHTMVPLKDNDHILMGDLVRYRDSERTKYEFFVSIAPFEGVCTRGKRKAAWGASEAAKGRVGKAPKVALEEEPLMCSVCHDMLVKPVVVGCGHSFCEECMVKWEMRTTQRRGRYETNFACPCCRATVWISGEQWSPNVTLRAVLETSVEPSFSEAQKEAHALRLGELETVKAEWARQKSRYVGEAARPNTAPSASAQESGGARNDVEESGLRIVQLHRILRNQTALLRQVIAATNRADRTPPAVAATPPPPGEHATAPGA